MKKIILWLLPKIAGLHPKNDDKEYPQLWYCWPKWTNRWGGFSIKKNDKRRINPLFILRTKICGFLTGHEISKTEWGYGGGGYVDRNCRWCDLSIKVPKKENFIPEQIDKDVLEELGYYNET